MYARTSRAGQHVEAQVAQLRHIAEQRQWLIVEEFVDDQVSSRRVTRPRFNAMLKSAETGQIDLVAAVALDRYARSVAELLGLGSRLDAWGVDFVSLRESIDTSTAVGRMVFTVLAAIAEFERDLIRERTLLGLDNARLKGRTLGRPRVGVNGEHVAKLRATGASWAAISRKLGLSEGSCRRAFKRQEDRNRALSKTSSALPT